ncbi:actin cortical patch SUR7/pH-response regulator pali [Microdochium trichocladiopsis]|uniref:Actin cortical patch SUR7/pH-response regulator pali n=1 Tax=Microdochium trichocladiopsis TaxID=1682393 RepID=A0A9P8YE46_9PEZI|nr:actin cortical patch SUR7/pH-response regulator pali [Microdochium trichocladiopsis]KAH7037207.1 actin cortical patch SUR7/pH-response regulator pali [Microdochium trichocladiopsis]
MAANGIRAIVAMVLLAGAVVMTLFVFLAGVTNTIPFSNTYFLQSETQGITGARQVSQWAYFYICAPGNVDCSGAWPAPSVGWAWSSGAQGVPAELIGDYGNGTTSMYYYYMWRFGWVTYLIAFAFAVFALLGGFLACLGRLGAALSGLLAGFSLFFYTIAASLMTATFVKMRDVLQANGHPSSIGQYGFGFTWASFACVFLATIIFCIGVRGDGSSSMRRRKSTRSSRSRSSIGSRRVKDDYA